MFNSHPQSAELLQDLHRALRDLPGDHGQESRTGHGRPEDPGAAADLCRTPPVRGTNTPHGIAYDMAYEAPLCSNSDVGLSGLRYGSVCDSVLCGPGGGDLL